jgi:alpha-mannosidase
MGVTSNRVDVKLAAAAAERALERRAEPLSALLLPPAQYPERLLRLAWRRLLDNAAHDSACACSADEVVDQVLVRYAEARQIGDGLAHEAPASTAAPAPCSSNGRAPVRFTWKWTGPPSPPRCSAPAN